MQFSLLPRAGGGNPIARRFVILSLLFSFAIFSVCIVAAEESVPLPPASAPLSLEECYQLAVAQSESLARREEDIREAEARYREILSTIYPQLNARAQQRIRDTVSSGRTVVGTDSGVSTINVQSKHPFDSAITLQQPIFTGFRELYLADAQQSEINALGLDRKRFAQLLYEDVANVFDQVVLYQEDEQILARAEKVLQERIRELGRFIELGKSRDSEVQAAESELAQNRAIKVQVNGLLSASREMLAFLTGIPASTLQLRTSPTDLTVPAVETLVSQTESRPDLGAARARIESAKNEGISREREYWPTVSLEGSAFPYQDPDTDRDWDVLLRFDLPIFDGGGIRARIDQSRARERAAELALREATRLAERDVRVAHSNVLAAKAESAQLRTRLEAARKNYDAQHRDYEFGVVTNLEVLAAIRNVQNAERELLSAETNVRTTMARLRVATGEIP